MPLSDDSGIPQGFERMSIKEPKAKAASYQGTAKPLLPQPEEAVTPVCKAQAVADLTQNH